MTFDFVFGLAIFAFLFFKLWIRTYDYWEKRGVVQMKPIFPIGTLSVRLLKGDDHIGLADQKIYNRFKGERYVGVYIFREPQLMIRDPELIKHILTKDFSSFVNRGMFPVIKHDFLNNHLFNLEGDAWKTMRTRFSPTFSSGKLKRMFNLIAVVAQQLKDYLNPLAENRSTLDFRDLIARFTTDVIATCGFGLEVNSINDPSSEFREIGRSTFRPSLVQFFKFNLMFFAPILTNIFPMTVFPPEVSVFMLKVVKDTINYRKKNNVVRNDFIDSLMKLNANKMTADKEDVDNGEINLKNLNSTEVDLTLKEMTAQVFVFFAAGFETSSSTASFCLYELSKNKDIQDKVRSEIDTVMERNGAMITYEVLQEMHYLENCIHETLRRYASLPYLRRKCVKTYKVPDSDLVIEKGVKIIIPIYSIHHDPKYYPNPYKFDPERFSEGSTKRHHYTHLPFGEGPRVCIGKQLGMLMVKMAVITVLKDFEVTSSLDLPEELPISPQALTTVPSVPIQLIVSKRKT